MTDTSERIPVYAIWHPHLGPWLALGMLTAYARAHDHGRLNDRYEIRRPESAESFLADLAERRGPAILLASDYVWSLQENLETAERACALHPDLLVVHGGPSCPKYEAEAARFLNEHAAVAHVLVRGEGEITLAEVLEALVDDPTPSGLDRLAGVAGVTYRRPGDGQVVRNEERERLADLSVLPSPYLTGEFDDAPPEVWKVSLTLETNRGCPYGCTFCDWGSATLSRIRKFDVDRVEAEMRWAVDHGIEYLGVADANFGIMARDVEIIRRLTQIKATTGSPRGITLTLAKNTTRHLVQIIDLLIEADIVVVSAIGIQTIDPDTLDAVDRANISTEHFMALAAELRRRSHPLECDLLLGLPGQTVESFHADRQHMFDHDILYRTWWVRVLPNSPMNDPDYRARHAIEVDPAGRVVATSTFTEDQVHEMARFAKVELIAAHFGVLRHVMRFVQWDHGVPAMALVARVQHLMDHDPTRFPLITWVFEYFEQASTVAVGWRAFYDEVGRLLAEEFGIPSSAELATVLRVQRALMPAPGRRFPDVVPLERDYVAYHQDNTRSLLITGRPETDRRSLASYGPGALTVEADPMGLCQRGNGMPAYNSRRYEADLASYTFYAHELLSPLIGTMAPSMLLQLSDEARAQVKAYLAEHRPPLPDLAELPTVGSTRVRLGARPRASAAG